MAAFTWLSWLEANQEVSLRLGDPSQIFWTQAEIYLYLSEALRVYYALTATWAELFTLTPTLPLASNWLSANGAGSPRQPVLTDTDVYTLIQYHLLEPPTGQTWTGTDQFSLADLSQACSRRRNEILQVAACNMAELSLPCIPGTSVINLPDTVLDVRRVRWVPAPGQGSPVTLQRGDSLSFQRYTPGYQQATASPLRWDVLGSSPQQLTLDTLVNVPSTVQVLSIMGAVDFDPPTPSPLLIPDDWMWVLKYGAMADVLSMEQEGKDLTRAAYCRQRYMEGLKLMQKMPWIMQGFLNNVAVDTQSLAGADRFNYEWQSRTTAFPELVVGGVDRFAMSPTPTSSTAVTMKMVANAPIPAAPTAYVQVSRDAMDAILSEAQHLALIKMGGKEFTDSTKLHKEFIGFCVNTNARLRESGIFPTDLRLAVPKQDEEQARFSKAAKE
jgi:hypothetical protein